MKPGKYSLLSVILLFTTICFFNYNHTHNNSKKLNVIAWDVYGYYLYLPATFIHHDPGLKHREWIDTLQTKYHPTETFYQANPGKDGKWVIKYSMGLAVLYSPFFFIAHTLAPAMDYAVDGLSPPYQMALIYGGLLYTLLGLIFFRKALLQFFTDKLTAILLVLITVGTNYFYIAAFDNIMPHNLMFALNAIILYATIRWHQEFKFKHMAMLAVALGLAILSRPTEMIWILVPLFWNMFDKKSVVEKFQQLLLHLKQVLLAGGIVFLIGLPQLLYWKATSGHYLFYSYEEKFLLTKPFLLKFLFSYKKGWLLYTPLMLFAIAGFRSLYLSNKTIFWGIFTFFIINLWVLSSWECWWYAASYSQRPMMESYIAMAIPLGYFMKWTLEQKALIKNSLITLISFVFLLNIFQTWQFSMYIIDPERMTGKYYWKVFGSTSVNEEYRKKYLEIDRGNSLDEIFDSEKDFNRKLPAFYTFEKEQSEIGLNSKHSLLLKGKDSFSPSFIAPYYALSSKEYVWIRASAYIFNKKAYKDNPSSLVVAFKHNGKFYKYKAIDTENLGLDSAKWQKISMDYLSPYLKSESDTVSVYFWHRGDDEVNIDNLKIEVFEPKE